MGGVDKLDFLITLYRTFIRSKKWILRMFAHGIDLASTNAWLEYRQQAEDLNTPKKEIKDLFTFRYQVASCLILVGKIKTVSKRRGRPSSAECSPKSSPESSPQSSPRAPPGPTTPTTSRRKEHNPIKEIRLDGVGHLPQADNKLSQTRCKMPNCTSKTLENNEKNNKKVLYLLNLKTWGVKRCSFDHIYFY
jgi:hypothetical protein